MTSLVRPFLSPMPNLNDASILITGGAGSFGKAFIVSVLQNLKARKTILFSRDELKQHDIQQDPAFQNQSSLRFLIGDVGPFVTLLPTS
jgi:UDP-N-acetylglucosamine 4,6-dehydratase